MLAEVAPNEPSFCTPATFGRPTTLTEKMVLYFYFTPNKRDFDTTPSTQWKPRCRSHGNSNQNRKAFGRNDLTLGVHFNLLRGFSHRTLTRNSGNTNSPSSAIVRLLPQKFRHKKTQTAHQRKHMHAYIYCGGGRELGLSSRFYTNGLQNIS